MQLPSPHAAFKGEIMNIKSLVCAGGQIMAATLPFALAGIILNALYPEYFALNLGQTRRKARRRTRQTGM
jgi:hypothetical protein